MKSFVIWLKISWNVCIDEKTSEWSGSAKEPEGRGANGVSANGVVCVCGVNLKWNFIWKSFEKNWWCTCICSAIVYLVKGIYSIQNTRRLAFPSVLITVSAHINAHWMKYIFERGGGDDERATSRARATNVSFSHLALSHSRNNFNYFSLDKFSSGYRNVHEWFAESECMYKTQRKQAFHLSMVPVGGGGILQVQMSCIVQSGARKVHKLMTVSLKIAFASISVFLCFFFVRNTVFFFLK